MQVLSESPAKVLDRVIGETLPDRRGLDAWRGFLRAHASLMRDLATDLATRTELSLNDFDVLAQLAIADGELRMTDLANLAFSSRSGMTRRVDRLVDEGLVQRCSADADARGKLVSLTDAGLQRLVRALPIHLQRVSERFAGRLDDEDLAVLERAMSKVTVDCSFG
jgi:DNA-binding MarR family transcriptional regulator